MRPRAIKTNGRDEISLNRKLAAHELHRERIRIERKQLFDVGLGCNEELELWRSVPITVKATVCVFDGIGRNLTPPRFGHTFDNMNRNGYIFRTMVPTALVQFHDSIPPKKYFSCRSHLPREGQLKANSNTCHLAARKSRFQSLVPQVNQQTKNNIQSKILGRRCRSSCDLILDLLPRYIKMFCKSRSRIGAT